MEPYKIEIVAKALKENREAISLVEQLMAVVRVWDNLIDSDKPVTKADVNLAFWTAMIEIQQNPFFVAYRLQILALLRDYFNAWLDANEFEATGNQHQKTVAFVLRDLIGGIVSNLAYLIGGYDWMRKVSPELRSIQFEEELSTYMEGLKNGNV